MFEMEKIAPTTIMFKKKNPPKQKTTKNLFTPKPWEEFKELNCSFIDFLDCNLEVYIKTVLWKNLKANCCSGISYQLL